MVDRSTACDFTVSCSNNFQFLYFLGEDGVDEMKEDLNASKIMYGFLRLQDPKTSLPKYVFFHWQGESVPGTRKGKAATHLR